MPLDELGQGVDWEPGKPVSDVFIKSLSNTDFSFPVEGLMMDSWVERSEMPSSTEAVVSTELSTELAAEGASILAFTKTKVRKRKK